MGEERGKESRGWHPRLDPVMSNQVQPFPHKVLRDSSRLPTVRGQPWAEAEVPVSGVTCLQALSPAGRTSLRQTPRELPCPGSFSGCPDSHGSEVKGNRKT